MFIKNYESMVNHTTFKCGGVSKWFCTPETEEELITVLKQCQKLKRKYFILGNGSNVLFKDFNGMVISTKKLKSFSYSRQEDGIIVTVGAGMELIRLNKLLASIGAMGLEFSYGIPASVGGAVFMNAGAYGGEIFNCLEGVYILKRNKKVYIKKQNISYSYRNGGLKGKVILSAVFKFSLGSCDDIQKRQFMFMKKRIESQPLNFPSAGSVFKRNGTVIPAQIIDKLGLKGVIIGRAMVSDKHAGFIVNLGGASYQDVISLINLIKEKVKNSLKVCLKEEIIVVGG